LKPGALVAAAALAGVALRAPQELAAEVAAEVAASCVCSAPLTWLEL